jgi:hypothetical protein
MVSGELIETYRGHGLDVVPVQPVSKVPMHKQWQTTAASARDFPADSNIAVHCGASEGNIVVVDCDHHLASQLSRILLPQTTSWGRRQNPWSHYMFHCEDSKPTKHIAPKSLADGRTCIVEILANTHLCLMPGSIHPSGEEIQFEASRALEDAGITTVEPTELFSLCKRIAGGAVLADHWVDYEGSRHELAYLLPAACLQNGWNDEEVRTFFNAFFLIVDDPERSDRKRCVEDTIDKFAQEQELGGWPKARDILEEGLAVYIAKQWGLGFIEDLITLPSSSRCSSSTPAWRELEPFEDWQSSPQTYPVEALGKLTKVVEVVEQIQQVPTALAANCCLTSVAAVVQPLFDVDTPIPFGRYPLSLFTMTLGDSGERKSSTEMLVNHAQDEWQKEQAPEEDQSWVPTLFFSSGTIEGLRKILADHWPSVAAINADASEFLGGHSYRENRDAATNAFLSNCWDGNIRGHMRAKDAKPLSLYGRRLSIGWMMQPKLFQLLINNRAEDQGVLSRFLIAYPESRIGSRLIHSKKDSPVGFIEPFYKRIRELLEREPQMDVETGVLSPAPISMSDEAGRLYLDYCQKIANSMAENQENYASRACANKAGQQLARLAGVMTAYANGVRVSEGTVNDAWILTNYYLDEWRNIYSRLQQDADKETKDVWAWLREKNKKEITVRELAQKGPYCIQKSLGRTSTEAARKALSVLCERGYVRSRSKNNYEVRPSEVDQQTTTITTL